MIVVTEKRHKNMAWRKIRPEEPVDLMFLEEDVGRTCKRSGSGKGEGVAGGLELSRCVCRTNCRIGGSEYYRK